MVPTLSVNATHTLQRSPSKHIPSLIRILKTFEKRPLPPPKYVVEKYNDA